MVMKLWFSYVELIRGGRFRLAKQLLASQDNSVPVSRILVPLYHTDSMDNLLSLLPLFKK